MRLKSLCEGWPELVVVAPRRLTRFLGRKRLSSFLSEQERAALLGLKIEKRQRDWLAGRLAAKVLLRRKLRTAFGLKVPAPSIEILNDAAGVPSFAVWGSSEFGREMNISITHNAGHGACAIGLTAETGWVGIDLELVRPVRRELLRYFLSDEERRWLEEEPEIGPAPTPVMLWAIKEAVLKADRKRTLTTMRQVVLTRGTDGSFGVQPVGVGRGAVCFTTGCEPLGGFFLAYATCRPAAETGSVRSS